MRHVLDNSTVFNRTYVDVSGFPACCIRTMIGDAFDPTDISKWLDTPDEMEDAMLADIARAYFELGSNTTRREYVSSLYNIVSQGCQYQEMAWAHYCNTTRSCFQQWGVYEDAPLDSSRKRARHTR